MSTIVECVITVNGATYSPGPADASGSCAAYPGSTPVGTTVTQNGTDPTTTSTSTSTTTTTVPVPCVTSGYAGCTGAGTNCGSGPDASCAGVTTGTAATLTPPPPVVAAAPPLAFTGAPVGLELVVALALVGAGMGLRRLARS
jgi:hypothetical protein